MAERHLDDPTEQLIRDFSTQTDEDLFRRIWLAAAVVAARGAVLTPELVLMQLASKETAKEWPELMNEIRALSAPNYLRER